MTIRTKLFIFIPLLVIFLNIIFFFIFQSSKQMQDSYNVMMDRILDYKEITDETNVNLRSLNQYLVSPNERTLNDFNQHKHTLDELQANVVQHSSDNNNLEITNFKNMLRTFIEQEEAVIQALEQGNLDDYTYYYSEAEKTAQYIKEKEQTLVDLELNFYQPLYNKIVADSKQLNQLGITLIFATTLLSILIAIGLSRSITNPIGRLVRTAKHIAKGNFSTSFPPVKTNDEIRILSDTFQQMVENIHNLMQKNIESVEKDRLVKELELKALQNQINPHFLFNTLNVISQLAFIEGADKTSDLTVSVSNLLRYNLRKLDKPVTLAEELNHAREYFIIQKARFRDRVQFITEIEEAALKQVIPCLTLQPILENAFVHGIEHLEDGAVITICVKKQADHVFVSIADNGVGMDEEMRQALLRLDEKEIPANHSTAGHTTGLGTKNVFKRLELFYEKTNLVNIKSKQKQGTVVEFRLPLKTV
ncbi:sensor histidine kinase [Caldibacillus lycopersici]|uniref:histidine kinase n=1 Tax=Perspicuibacillus lycopersici TaxID=1325689 RepID=A0AAE3IQJ4_9BACI|nr:sensor histidine kinase [Perspicuibacillus lycopersici]MCU9612713.1 sensor histidine kinase [Perspicuibacillus lycopersici]